MVKVYKSQSKKDLNKNIDVASSADRQSYSTIINRFVSLLKQKHSS